MNWRAIKAIVQRDLLAVFRSKGVMLPLIIVPLLFMIILPGAFGLLTPVINQLPGANMPDIALFLDRLPPALLAQFEGYTTDQLMIVFMLVYLLAPMFLIIPLMVASVVAADSFAGEKERKTLEALIYTPTTDLELFIGKVLSAMAPGAGGHPDRVRALWSVGSTSQPGPRCSGIFFPDARSGSCWCLWVAPGAAATGIRGYRAGLVASVSSFQEANQIAGVVVLPIVMLVVGANFRRVMYFERDC
jgi:ABC-2 type transport system permease protein